MVANMQAPVLCECIDTRIGNISTAGGRKPVIIMQLQNEAIPEPLIKYFNCNLSDAGNHSVSKKSDFANIYRCTLGSNPTKRFSKAQQLIKHLSGYWFIASYEQAQSRSRKQYFKVTHIKPEAPARNDAWTLDGTLKKVAKNSPFQTPENGDGETLEASNSLGLEAVFHPTKKRPNQGKITNTLSHVCDAHLFTTLTDTAQCFYNDRLDVLLKRFGFEKPEAEIVAMKDVIIKYGQAAYLPKLVSEQTNDEWLTEFNGVEQTIWN